MGKSFTLDNFKQHLDAKYGPLELLGFPGEGGPIRLLPMLSHGEERRAEISAVMASHRDKSKTGEDDEESSDLNASIRQVEELITLTLERKSDIDRIKQGFGGNGQAMIELWEQYQEATRPGDPSPSDS